MQLVAHYTTDPTLNVNLSQAPWPGWDGILPGGYPSYWLFTTALTGIVLWLAGRILLGAFPPPVAMKGGET